MSRINAALSACVLTVLVLLVLNHFPFIPLWALFIAWACFFHMGGGERPAQALLTTNVHMGIGAIASWLSALLLFANPLSGTLA